MKSLILGLLFALPLSALANSELNGNDTVADHPLAAPARSLIVEIRKGAKPFVVAQFAASAEAPENLSELTPSTELQHSQGTPQWGFSLGWSPYYGGWSPYYGCQPWACMPDVYTYNGLDYYPVGWQDGSTWGGESYSAGGPTYGYYTAGDQWNRGLY